MHDTALCTVAFSSPLGRNIRCAQRYLCSVADLLCRGSVRGTVELCVRKRVTVDQVRTAGLVQECTMFRDRLVRLHDAITVGDFTDIKCYLCHVDCSLLSSFLFFFSVLCVRFI